MSSRFHSSRPIVAAVCAALLAAGCVTIPSRESETASEYRLTWDYMEHVGVSITLVPGTGLERARPQLWVENKLVRDFRIVESSPEMVKAVVLGGLPFRVSDNVLVRVLTGTEVHDFDIGDPRTEGPVEINGTKYPFGGAPVLGGDQPAE